MPSDRVTANMVTSGKSPALSEVYRRTHNRLIKAFERTGNIVTEKEQQHYLTALCVPQGAIIEDVETWSHDFSAICREYSSFYEKATPHRWKMAIITQSPEAVMLKLLERDVVVYWMMRPTLKYKYNNKVIRC